MSKKGYKSIPWLFGKEIEIPEEWEVVSLGSLCNTFTKQTGFDYTTHIKPKLVQTFKKGTIPFIQNKDFEGKTTNYDTDYFIPENIANIFTKILLNEKCLLITISGNIGNVGIFSNEQNAFVGGAVAVAKFKNKNLLNWIMYYLLSSMGHKNFLRLTKTASHQNLILDDLRKMKVLILPLPEQQKIATILSNVDNLIDSTSKIIKNSKSLKKSLMQKLLTRGIGHTKFKKVPWLFGKEIEIPEEWEFQKIRDCCNILDSQRIPINSEERRKIQGNIPYYGANGIQGYVNDHIFDEEIILLAEDGGYFEEYKTRPIAQYIIEKSWVNNHAHVLNSKKNILLKWIFYSLVHKNITRYINGSTRTKLNQSDLQQISILIPPLQEQQKIATILSNIDAQIDSQTQYKEKLEKLKKSLMQKLLTGEVRVIA